MVAAGLLATAAIAVVALVLLTGSDYADGADEALRPLSTANTGANRELARLHDGSAGDVARVIDRTLARVDDARTAVRAADGGGKDELEPRIVAALDAEGAYLEGARSGKPDVEQLQSDGEDMGRAFASLDGEVQVVALQDDDLTAWARDRARTEHRRRTDRANLREFVNDVDQILQASRPGRQSISQVAVGIDQGIELAEARTLAANATANREARLGDARALNAPPGRASEARALLVESFERSLANDRDFQQAIDDYESDDFSGFIREAYHEAFASSGAATAAKERFLSVYNGLRAKFHLPAVANDY